MDGTCVQACLTTQCGLNAQCRATSHTGVCHCAAEFTGNAYIECIRGKFCVNIIPAIARISCDPLKNIYVSVPIIPHTPIRPECYANSECSSDKQCINSLCVNPCVVGDPCGRNALCYVNNNNPICKCPVNYAGDPRINCIPRKCSIGKLLFSNDPVLSLLILALYVIRCIVR